MPDGFRGDPAGLRELAGSLSGAAAAAAEAGDIFDEVPLPAPEVYGSQPTADAVDRVVSAWAAEVELLRQVCARMRDTARDDADGLEEAEALNAGPIDSRISR